MTTSRKRRGPSPGQLDAALEGARDPVNFNTAHNTEPDAAAANAQRSSGGSSAPLTGSARGHLAPEGDAEGVEPDEAIKRETAVFVPGTMKKPS